MFAGAVSFTFGHDAATASADGALVVGRRRTQRRQTADKPVGKRRFAGRQTAD